MPIDDIRAALLALLNQPVAVASFIVLAGFNAAIWLLVFERVGFPTALASLLIVPPLTFLLPLYFAVARWPGQQRVVRFPVRGRRARTRSVHRLQAQAGRVQRQLAAVPALGDFSSRRPLRLDADGLPRVRIPLTAPMDPREWPGRRTVQSRFP